MTSGFEEARDLHEAVRISWIGHSMFLLEDGEGRRLVTDPYNEYVGYAMPDVTADIVLVSHDHADHANVAMLKGDPQVIRDPSPREVAGVSIRGVPTWHDDKQGAERGENIAFRWEMQGLAFIHLGDLGHDLDPSSASELAHADVLFVPVGGFYTLEPEDAAAVVRELSPRLAIPMHFRNAACGFPIASEEPFLSHFSSVQRTGKAPIYVSPDRLPDVTTIVLMDYLA